MGRLFDFVVDKHSELAHLGKSKFKGRVVFQGNNVKDETGLAALFAEAASSASHIECSKLLDAVASLPHCHGQQSDAVSAYTQALLYGDGRIDNVDIWVELPPRSLARGMAEEGLPTPCRTAAPSSVRPPALGCVLGVALPGSLLLRWLEAG